MDGIIRGLKWKVYMCCLDDDDDVHSSTFEDYLERLKYVILCIGKSGLNLTSKKCTFAQKEIKVLSNFVFADRIRPDP